MGSGTHRQSDSSAPQRLHFGGRSNGVPAKSRITIILKATPTLPSGDKLPPIVPPTGSGGPVPQQSVSPPADKTAAQPSHDAAQRFQLRTFRSPPAKRRAPAVR